MMKMSNIPDNFNDILNEAIEKMNNNDNVWIEHCVKTRGYNKIYYQHSCCPVLYDSPYNYCPNCGEYMEERQNE